MDTWGHATLKIYGNSIKLFFWLFLLRDHFHLFFISISKFKDIFITPINTLLVASGCFKVIKIFIGSADWSLKLPRALLLRCMDSVLRVRWTIIFVWYFNSSSLILFGVGQFLVLYSTPILVSSWYGSFWKILVCWPPPNKEARNPCQYCIWIIF